MTVYSYQVDCVTVPNKRSPNYFFGIRHVISCFCEEIIDE